MDTSSWGTEEAHVLMSSVVLKGIHVADTLVNIE